MHNINMTVIRRRVLNYEKRFVWLIKISRFQLLATLWSYCIIDMRRVTYLFTGELMRRAGERCEIPASDDFDSVTKYTVDKDDGFEENGNITLFLCLYRNEILLQGGPN